MRRDVLVRKIVEQCSAAGLYVNIQHDSKIAFVNNGMEGITVKGLQYILEADVLALVELRQIVNINPDHPSRVKIILPAR